MLKVKKLNKDAKIPTKAFPTDAGWDLYALEDVVIPPNVVYRQDMTGLIIPHLWTTRATLVSTGIAVKIPEGYYGRVASKSGLAVKGIEVGAGVIDSEYTGELKVLLRNFSEDTIGFKAGEKIAQLVIEKIGNFDIMEVDKLEDTDRNRGGFGSTGK